MFSGHSAGSVRNVVSFLFARAGNPSSGMLDSRVKGIPWLETGRELIRGSSDILTLIGLSISDAFRLLSESISVPIDSHPTDLRQPVLLLLLLLLLLLPMIRRNR
jgi:hypothetical protein